MVWYFISHVDMLEEEDGELFLELNREMEGDVEGGNDGGMEMCELCGHGNLCRNVHPSSRARRISRKALQYPNTTA